MLVLAIAILRGTYSQRQMGQNSFCKDTRMLFERYVVINYFQLVTDGLTCSLPFMASMISGWLQPTVQLTE